MDPDLSGSPLPVPLLFLQIPVGLGSHSWPQSIPGVVSPVLTRGGERLPWICCPWPSKCDLVWSLLYAQSKYAVGSYSARYLPSPQVLLSHFQLLPSVSRCMELFHLSYKTLCFSLLKAMRFLLAQSSHFSRFLWIQGLTFSMSTTPLNVVSCTNLLRVQSVHRVGSWWRHWTVFSPLTTPGALCLSRAWCWASGRCPLGPVA